MHSNNIIDGVCTVELEKHREIEIGSSYIRAIHVYYKYTF